MKIENLYTPIKPVEFFINQRMYNVLMNITPTVRELINLWNEYKEYSKLILELEREQYYYGFTDAVTGKNLNEDTPDKVNVLNKRCIIVLEKMQIIRETLTEEEIESYAVYQELMEKNQWINRNY